MLVSEMAYPPGGMGGKAKRAFYSTPEDTYGNLAQYYDIPAVSFRCGGHHFYTRPAAGAAVLGAVGSGGGGGSGGDDHRTRALLLHLPTRGPRGAHQVQ